jgi:hypothetical protein
MDVRLPNGTVIRGVPDGTTRAQLAQKLQTNGMQVPAEWMAPTREERRAAMVASNPGEYDPASPEFQAKNGAGGFGGAMRDVGRAAVRAPLTIGDTALTVGRNMVAAPVAGLAGAVTAPLGFIPGMQGVGARNVERVQNFIAGQPLTDGGEAVSGALAYPFEKLAQAGDWAGQKASDATGSPLIGAGVNTAIQSIPALLGGRATIKRGNSGPGNPRRVAGAGEVEAARPVPAQAERVGGLERVPETAPSIDDLRAQAKDAYKRASDAGIKVSQNSLNGLKSRIASDLKKEGLDPTLHPSTSAAVKRVLGAKGELTLDDLETLRKISKDAETAIAPADRRLASKIVEHIDDYVEDLDFKDVVSGDPAKAAALKEARGLYSRMKKAEEIETLIDRAKISAPNFSASGMENALRTEFRALAKNERRMRRFNAEERAAIRKVAMGGPLENILRQVGKLAPTGVVSMSMGSLGGFVLGGPAGAAALPAAGAASRYAATRMTMKNANAASDLMRRGPNSAPRTARKVTVE